VRVWVNTARGLYDFAKSMQQPELKRYSGSRVTGYTNNYISRESKTTRSVLWSRASVCLSVSVRGRMPTLLHGLGCNLGEW